MGSISVEPSWVWSILLVAATDVGAASLSIPLIFFLSIPFRIWFQGGCDLTLYMLMLFELISVCKWVLASRGVRLISLQMNLHPCNYFADAVCKLLNLTLYEKISLHITSNESPPPWFCLSCMQVIKSDLLWRLFVLRGIYTHFLGACLCIHMTCIWKQKHAWEPSIGR